VSTSKDCNCRNPKPLILRGETPSRVCFDCGGRVPKKMGEGESTSVIITQEQKALALSLIGQQQQIILKHQQFKAKSDEAILASRRIIDDIKNQFGLKE
jgi:hypothetical protein